MFVNVKIVHSGVGSVPTNPQTGRNHPKERSMLAYYFDFAQFHRLRERHMLFVTKKMASLQHLCVIKCVLKPTHALGGPLDTSFVHYIWHN